MQVCLRVKGPQVVPLVLVLHNDNPGENRFEFPPGLATRKPVTFNDSSIEKPEQEWHDKNIVTMWDKKAWFSAPVAKDWYEWFVKKTDGVRKSVGKEPSIALQVDNLKQQIAVKLQHICSLITECTSSPCKRFRQTASIFYHLQIIILGSYCI